MEERLLEIIAQKIQDKLPEKEEQELEQLLLLYPEYRDVVEKLQSSPEYINEMFIASAMPVEQIWDKLLTRTKHRLRRKRIGLCSSGIAALILIGFSMWQLQDWSDKPTETVRHYAMGKVILECSDGRQVIVADQPSLKITEAESEIVLQDSLGLVYNKLTVSDAVERFNTLYVPRGCEFALTLSDGTRIRINSDSKLKYPVSFSNRNRHVYLEGEAYFEVAADSCRPFIVKTSKMNIEVTGTAFNVMAYASESLVRTTLVKGHVNIYEEGKRERYSLSPGDQCTLNTNNEITVTQVNPEPYIAWVKGLFFFDQETVESLMKKIGRWYDLEIVYLDASIKKERFYGTVSRYEEVSQVLDMLVLTKTINYDVKDRTIYIRK